MRSGLLSKSVCRSCVNRHSPERPWAEANEDGWAMGYVRCPEGNLWLEPGDVWCRCRYVVEHVVSRSGDDG